MKEGRGAGNLPAHVVRFARVLRRAGLPVGPASVVDATRALGAVDVTRRSDFYWALHAVFVRRREHREVFRLAFERFWREVDRTPEAVRELLSASRLSGADRRAAAGARRVAEAMGEAEARPEPPGADGEARVGAAYSARERLRTRDFAAMSADELAEARVAVQRMRFGVRRIPTRRFRPDPRGERVDLRASLRAGLRGGGAHVPLRWKSRSRRPPPLVALVDVSGSMEAYSRILLRFLHALTRYRPRVHTFLFGTQLSNVTRSLRERDVDVALERAGRQATDWSGGTRIGRSLARFNRAWSRRVLSRGAVVLLITDGLDRDAGAGLEREMERLHRASRRLLWLNPLLRYDGFEPRAAGIRAMLPHVDAFLPVHDLRSLEALGRALERLEEEGRPVRRVSPSVP